MREIPAAHLPSKAPTVVSSWPESSAGASVVVTGTGQVFIQGYQSSGRGLKRIPTMKISTVKVIKIFLL